MSRVKIQCISGVGDALEINEEKHADTLWIEVLNRLGPNVGISRSTAISLGMALTEWGRTGNLPQLHIKVDQK